MLSRFLPYPRPAVNDVAGHIEIPLMQTLSRAIASDTLTLPTLPEVAQRLQRLRDDPGLEPAQLVAEISRDMATAGRLLQIANSAAYRRGRPADSLSAAVARLGMELSCTIAIAFSMEQLFCGRSPLINLRLRQAWIRGQEVAALARVLATTYTVLNPELAMLAGLLHGVGKLPILRIADADDFVARDAAALDRLLQALHPAAGCRVLRAWKFPEAVADVPLQCLDFDRHHEGPADYADVLTVARLHTARAADCLPPGLDVNQVQAFTKLDISPAVDVIEVIDADALAASREMLGVAA